MFLVHYTYVVVEKCLWNIFGTFKHQIQRSCEAGNIERQECSYLLYGTTCKPDLKDIGNPTIKNESLKSRYADLCLPIKMDGWMVR